MKKLMLKFVILMGSMTLYYSKVQAQTPSTSIVDFDTVKVFPKFQEEIKLDSTKGAAMKVAPLAAPPVAFTDRIVYWVHGLGGHVGSWTKPRQIVEGDPTTYPLGVPGFAPRKITSVLPVEPTNPNVSYSDVSINQAATDLSVNMRNADLAKAPLNVRNNARDFIISHSQGGMVSRYYDYKRNNGTDPNPKQIDGIVTFGTPHKGAKIVNSTTVVNGKSPITDFAVDGLQSLSAGPIQNICFFGNIVSFSLNSGCSSFLTQLVDSLTTYVANTVIPTQFGQYTQPVAQSYAIGSPTLPILNNNDLTTNIHKSAFYGKINEPVIWNMFDSFLKNKPEEKPAFSADQYSNVPAIANKVTNTYVTLKQINEAAASVYLTLYDASTSVAGWVAAPAIAAYQSYCSNNCGGALNGLVCNNITSFYCGYQTLDNAAKGYGRGLEWIGNANDSWKSMIGGLEMNLVQDGCEMWCYQKVGCDPFLPPNHPDCWDYVFRRKGTGVINCNQYNTVTCSGSTPSYKIVKTYKDTDGAVTVESASGWVGLQWPARPMLGSNHMQMRNDGNTSTALNNLFDGLNTTLPNGQPGPPAIDPWFKTSTR
jgi:hypothetical protein